jgi:glucose-6-phosphate 1-dehydrogenase
MKLNPLAAGLATSRQAAPFVVFIFGVTGDLTRNKLIPALFSLYLKGSISRFRIIGFARRPWNKEVFRENAEKMLGDFPDVDVLVKRNFLDRLDYISSTFESEEGYRQINGHCDGFANRLYYLSTPPDAYDDIIGNLGRLGLAEESEGYTRIVVEKPFGRDLATARALNASLAAHFREEQIFRIDHYLGKETVQNIMLLRFGNGIFEPIWNNRYIDHIQITVAEKIGVGTRANYYEQAGTIRDMVQNHLFQLLSLTTMEPPNDLGPDTIRSEKVKIVRSLRPITHRQVQTQTVRAQYARGYVDGEEVPGYREEEGVSEQSRTETYVAMKLFLDTWRWAGVPIYVRSGKRLARRVTEISVHFKEPPLQVFYSSYPAMNRNILIMRIQPDEGLSLNMNVKVPGHQADMRPVNMDFAYGSAFGEAVPEAYERLLLDAFVGDSTLYNRRDEIEASWTFITRILQGWERDPTPLASYLPGSSGPEEAKMMIQAEGRRWRKI